MAGGLSVMLQRLESVEAVAAHFANVLPLPNVLVHMLVVIVAIAERASTNLTAESTKSESQRSIYDEFACQRCMMKKKLHVL